MYLHVIMFNINMNNYSILLPIEFCSIKIFSIVLNIYIFINSYRNHIFKVVVYRSKKIKPQQMTIAALDFYLSSLYQEWGRLIIIHRVVCVSLAGS